MTCDIFIRWCAGVMCHGDTIYQLYTSTAVCTHLLTAVGQYWCCLRFCCTFVACFETNPVQKHTNMLVLILFLGVVKVLLVCVVCLLVSSKLHPTLLDRKKIPTNGEHVHAHPIIVLSVCSNRCRGTRNTLRRWEGRTATILPRRSLLGRYW